MTIDDFMCGVQLMYGFVRWLAFDMTTLKIRKPDDWHVHFRDGEILNSVAPFTAAQFARAIIMPNLVPPVTTAVQGAGLQEAHRGRRRRVINFTPLMTCYLTDTTDASDLISGHKSGIFTAAKLYPAHATTNSAAGVTDIERIQPVLEAMAESGMPLAHARRTAAAGDRRVRSREGVHRRHPVAAAEPHSIIEDRSGAHHHGRRRRGGPRAPPAPRRDNHAAALLYSRNALFNGGLRPHLYCLPVLKREEHRLALQREPRQAGNRVSFWAPTRRLISAISRRPHAAAPGVFGAPAALSAYLKVFEEEDALDHFETFASLNGPAFYGLPPNEESDHPTEAAGIVCKKVPDQKLGEYSPCLAAIRLTGHTVRAIRYMIAGSR